MYVTHSEYKTVVAEKFIRTLKGKIYKELTANGNKNYLSYLNQLFDELNNNYHHSIGKKLTDADHFAFPKKFELILKVPKYKVSNRAKITNYKSIFKVAPKTCQSKYIFIDSELRVNPWTYQIKDLNGKKIIRFFCKREFLLSRL